MTSPIDLQPSPAIAARRRIHQFVAGVFDEARATVPELSRSESWMINVRTSPFATSNKSVGSELLSYTSLGSPKCR
jgi:hypothetical protein